ncbi:hypothetical protein SLEP1_g4596 [Rubroshorea leprosula]|uniref:Uncharacterized protein n=1 Tax=Rubroshorea leprosula TaxID=152421 RepID=A0AAV5HTJ3_9ROSI|nr:hypothetical protein SLEP1_g4596 [Rubroshorea leprosula]
MAISCLLFSTLTTPYQKKKKTNTNTLQASVSRSFLINSSAFRQVRPVTIATVSEFSPCKSVTAAKLPHLTKLCSQSSQEAAGCL